MKNRLGVVSSYIRLFFEVNSEAWLHLAAWTSIRSRLSKKKQVVEETYNMISFIESSVASKTNILRNPSTHSKINIREEK